MEKNEPGLRRLLSPIPQNADVVLDTDAYNEIDDQFALAYLFGSKEAYTVKAVTAAPFSNARADSPALGMEKSYDEVQNILNLMGKSDFADRVFRGSKEYLKGESVSVSSPASDEIIRLALAQPESRPLYILAIGAITNIASALLSCPDIARKIYVVWLGGHAHHWPRNDEFNLRQDIAAARVVFGSGAPVVQLPCMGVVSHLMASGYELKHYLEGKNPLCDYLYRITWEEGSHNGKKDCWSRILWDVSAVAWLKGGLVRDYVDHIAMPTYDMGYSFAKTRPFYRYAYWLDRDAIMQDLYNTLASF
ncbi:MAG: nucleoside hydrolase [Christensenellales bacterium]|jgi:inosine-uridine nucleoside N-ribohydrolase